jgi:hypothetical protein
MLMPCRLSVMAELQGRTTSMLSSAELIWPVHALQGRGFFAGGKGSKLVAGDECEAVESGDTGWQADEEGLIEAGAACRAEKGGGHGWLASDKVPTCVGGWLGPGRRVCEWGNRAY